MKAVPAPASASPSPPRDPDMRAALTALRRAALQARELSERTGTPLYVMRDGQVVDLNAAGLRAAQPPATYSKP